MQISFYGKFQESFQESRHLSVFWSVLGTITIKSMKAPYMEENKLQKTYFYSVSLVLTQTLKGMEKNILSRKTQ